MKLETPALVLQRYLSDAELSQDEFGKMIGVSRYSINQIITGKRNITADMAVRLEAPTGIPASSWMYLQAELDIKIARKKLLGNSS